MCSHLSKRLSSMLLRISLLTAFEIEPSAALLDELHICYKLDPHKSVPRIQLHCLESKTMIKRLIKEITILFDTFRPHKINSELPWADLCAVLNRTLNHYLSSKGDEQELNGELHVKHNPVQNQAVSEVQQLHPVVQPSSTAIPKLALSQCKPANNIQPPRNLFDSQLVKDQTSKLTVLPSVASQSTTSVQAHYVPTKFQPLPTNGSVAKTRLLKTDAIKNLMNNSKDIASISSNAKYAKIYDPNAKTIKNSPTDAKPVTLRESSESISKMNSKSVTSCHNGTLLKANIINSSCDTKTILTQKVSGSRPIKCQDHDHLLVVCAEDGRGSSGGRVATGSVSASVRVPTTTTQHNTMQDNSHTVNVTNNSNESACKQLSKPAYNLKGFSPFKQLHQLSRYRSKVERKIKVQQNMVSKVCLSHRVPVVAGQVMVGGGGDCATEGWITQNHESCGEVLSMENLSSYSQLLAHRASSQERDSTTTDTDDSMDRVGPLGGDVNNRLKSSLQRPASKRNETLCLQCFLPCATDNDITSLYANCTCKSMTDRPTRRSSTDVEPILECVSNDQSSHYNSESVGINVQTYSKDDYSSFINAVSKTLKCSNSIPYRTQQYIKKTLTALEKTSSRGSLRTQHIGTANTTVSEECQLQPGVSTKKRKDESVIKTIDGANNEQKVAHIGNQKNGVHTVYQKDCMYTGSQKDCMYTGSQKDCVHTGNMKCCVHTGNQNDCVHTGRQKDCAHTGRQKDCDNAGKQKDCDNAGKQNDCVHTGRQKECVHTGRQKDCERTGKQKDCQHTGKHKDCELTGSHKDCELTGSQKDCVHTRNQNDCVHTGRQKDCAHTGRQKDCDNAGKQKDCDNAGKQNDCVHTGRQKECVHTGRQKDCERTGKQKDCDSAGNQKDCERTGRQKDCERTGKQKDCDNAGKQKDCDSAGKQKDCERTGNQEDCVRTGKHKYCADTGNTKDCELTGNTKDCEHTGNTKDCEHTGNMKDCMHTGSQKVCELTGNTKDCEHTGNMKNCVHTGSQKDCELAGNKKDCEHTGNMKDCVHTGSQKDCELTGNKKDCVHTGNTKDCELTGKQKDCKQTGKQKDCKQTGKQKDCIQTRKQKDCVYIGKKNPNSVKRKIENTVKLTNTKCLKLDLDVSAVLDVVHTTIYTKLPERNGITPANQSIPSAPTILLQCASKDDPQGTKSDIGIKHTHDEFDGKSCTHPHNLRKTKKGVKRDTEMLLNFNNSVDTKEETMPNQHISTVHMKHKKAEITIKSTVRKQCQNNTEKMAMTRRKQLHQTNSKKSTSVDNGVCRNVCFRKKMTISRIRDTKAKNNSQNCATTCVVETKKLLNKKLTKPLNYCKRGTLRITRSKTHL